MIEMTRNRIRERFTEEKYHERILDSFELGKYVIIYGSILLLTFLGVITWIFGAFGFFSLFIQSIREESFSDTISILRTVQMNGIFLLDIFLLSVVLFIIAIGLYGIFIRKGVKLPFTISKMNQLEEYVFGTIIAILLVNALSKILSPTDVATKESIVAVALTCAIVLVISIYLAIRNSSSESGEL